VDLPSRLLERITHSSDTYTLPEKSSDRTRRSKDGPYYPRTSTAYEKNTPILDPFDASPYSASFFIDCVESPVSIAPPSRSSTQRPQSFLLLGEPTKALAYLRIPLRRERPSSIQSMPLPSQSRRSSFQYCPPSRDKYDRCWVLEEGEESLGMEDVEEMHDPAAHIDWRQFHSDLLCEEQ